MRIASLLALTLIACAPAAPPPRKRPPPLVQVQHPEVRAVDVVLDYSVDVRPIEQADLQSKVAGYVQRVLVDRGDKVQKGQLLVTIRPSELPDQVSQAKEQVGQAEANFKLASENARRAHELFARGLISRADLDNTEAQLQVASAGRGASHAGLGAVSTRLAETDITAPFAGWVTKRMLDPGALVTPGPTSQTILQLMRVDVVRVFVNVLEKDVPLMHRGATARITVDALPNRRFDGTVARFAPALDAATRTLEVEVQIPNERDASGEYVLKPGMYGHVAMAVDTHPSAVVLPVQAVVSEEDRHAVFVIERIAGAAPKVHRRDVEVGFDGGEWLEITKGLRGDEEVVSAGIDLISDGATVTISEPARAAPSGETARSH